jgi:hypothetical protein
LSDAVFPTPAKIAPNLVDLGLDLARPLLIVDVDEVLGLFLRGFGDYLGREGLEFRLDRYGLFENVYSPGGTEPVPLDHSQALMETFFRENCGEMEPTPGAAEALRKLSRSAEILILSNAPPCAERVRAGWLRKHGFDHPLVLNNGPKGPITAAITAQTAGRTAFIDDFLPNLDSVADHAPGTITFQHVADERLRPLAPRSPRHIRIDEWPQLAQAVEAAIRG